MGVSNRPEELENECMHVGRKCRTRNIATKFSEDYTSDVPTCCLNSV